MSKEECKNPDAAPTHIKQNLHPTQAQYRRHKCVDCAYKEGEKAAFINISSFSEFETCEEGKQAPVVIIANLHKSQAGEGRHKCAVCAYHAGLYSKLRSLPEIKVRKITIVDPPRYIKKEVNAKRKDGTTGKKDKAPKVEIRNKLIGFLGEKLVIDHEKNTLIEAGRNDLAKKIVHVSKEEGDGVGYDIRSFSLNGDEKHIEVKTTISSINTPFYLTKNELEYSIKEPENYFLYRVFSFNELKNSGEVFIITGDISEQFNLVPINFRGFRA